MATLQHSAQRSNELHLVFHLTPGDCVNVPDLLRVTLRFPGGIRYDYKPTAYGQGTMKLTFRSGDNPYGNTTDPAVIAQAVLTHFSR